MHTRACRSTRAANAVVSPARAALTSAPSVITPTLYPEFIPRVTDAWRGPRSSNDDDSYAAVEFIIDGGHAGRRGPRVAVDAHVDAMRAGRHRDGCFPHVGRDF